MRIFILTFGMAGDKGEAKKYRLVSLESNFN